MKNNGLRYRALAGALAVGLVATSAACASSAPTSKGGSTTGPITIGMSLPMTGPVADIAGPGYQGYQVWADDVNSSGGLQGREVKFKLYDDAFDQNIAISDYTKLIAKDKVDLLLGTFSSMLNLPVAQIAERNKMLYVEPSGGADEIFARKFKYLFFAQPATTQNLPDRFVEVISKMPQADRPKTAAYLTADDPNTAQATPLFKEKLEALGVSTVYDKTYAPDTSNFDAVANAVKQKNPELLISGALASDGTALINSLHKVDFTPPMIYQVNVPTQPGYGKAIGEANTEGIFSTVAWSADSTYPGNQEFVAAYKKKFGDDPTEDAANSYTAGQVLAAAVEGVGSLDQSKLAEWLHQNTVDTIVGPLSWDDTGRPMGSLLLSQWQNGKLQIVAPADVATAEAVVTPKPAWK